MKRAKALQPPSDLSPEAQAEWCAVVSAIESDDRELKPADVSLLTLYIRTWTLYQTSYKSVLAEGSVQEFKNGMVGQNPHFKCCKELGSMMARHLEQLGLTPKSRDFDRTNNEDPGDFPITF